MGGSSYLEAGLIVGVDGGPRMTLTGDVQGAIVLQDVYNTTTGEEASTTLRFQVRLLLRAAADCCALLCAVCSCVLCCHVLLRAAALCIEHASSTTLLRLQMQPQSHAALLFPAASGTVLTTGNLPDLDAFTVCVVCALHATHSCIARTCYTHFHYSHAKHKRALLACTLTPTSIPQNEHAQRRL